MRYWRATLLLLLAALLPLQLMAGQFAPCPHEHDVTSHAVDHHHHHHAAHHDMPSTQLTDGHHTLCPDCEASAESRTQASTTHSGSFHCDHCQCCHPAVSPAVPSSNLAGVDRQTDHWVATLTLSHYSRSIPPGLRPPLSLA